MPRLVHVISTVDGVGGAERVVAALAGEGGRRGWEQLVLNPFAADPDGSGLRELCRPARFEARACARLPELPGTLVWLRQRLRSFRPDIVHVHLTFAMLTVPAVAPSKTTLILSHHHGNSLLVQGRKAEAALERVVRRRFTRVVGVSEWLARYLVEEAGYPRERVVCIPNGWSGAPAPSAGLAPVPTIACVANFRPGKGQDTVVRAFARVRDRLPTAELLLAGAGELQPSVERLAKELGVAEGVHFLGQTADVWPVLARADVFTLASEYEALGLAVLEAMAAGLPVVATSVGGVPDLVRPGVTGTLVGVGDDSALAGALLELLEDGGRRAAMGEAGRAAAAGLTMDQTLRRYFELYESVLP